VSRHTDPLVVVMPSTSTSGLCSNSSGTPLRPIMSSSTITSRLGLTGAAGLGFAPCTPSISASAPSMIFIVRIASNPHFASSRRLLGRCHAQPLSAD